MGVKIDKNGTVSLSDNSENTISLTKDRKISFQTKNGEVSFEGGKLSTEFSFAGQTIKADSTGKVSTSVSFRDVNLNLDVDLKNGVADVRSFKADSPDIAISHRIGPVETIGV